MVLRINNPPPLIDIADLEEINLTANIPPATFRDLPPLRPRRRPRPYIAFKPKLNIFALDEDPVVAASYANDMHVSKMTTESAQILCTVYKLQTLLPRESIDEINKIELDRNPDSPTLLSIYNPNIDKYNALARTLGVQPILPELYRSTHISHPSVVWANTNQRTYNWLYTHFMALGTEYQNRYGKEHESVKKLGSILRAPPVTMRDEVYMLPVRVVASPRLMTRYYGHNYIVEGNIANHNDAFNNGMEETWINAVSIYREYYYIDKFNLGQWTNREIPYWFKEYHENLGAKEKIVERKIRGRVVQTRSMLYP